MGTSPATMRSSVVLPEPLRPDRASRSPRSTLKETPLSRGFPATSFPSPDAIATATEQDGRAASLSGGRARRDRPELAPTGARDQGGAFLQVLGQPGGSGQERRAVRWDQEVLRAFV